ncbi:hypothetical protein [Candidatus Parabeggiatoa sp. HSG14]|nr:hypothetical protein [Thiotrichales bacterium HSG14]
MKKIARLLGITLQALVLGILLFIAIGQLVALETDARIFLYQAF